VLLFFCLRLVLGDVGALAGAFVYAVLPMATYFGSMPCHESPTTAFLLLTAWHGTRFLARPSRRGFWATLGALALTQLTDWPGYYAAVGVALAAVLVHAGTPRGDPEAAGLGRSAALRLAWVALLCALVTGLLVLGYSYLCAGSFGTMAGKAAYWSWSDSGGPVAVASRLGQRFLDVRAWFTRTGYPVAALGLVLLLARRELRPAGVLLVMLATPAVLHIVVFWRGAWIHYYWWYYLSLLVALLSGVVVASALAIPRRHARLAALALLVAAGVLTAASGARKLGRAFGQEDMAPFQRLEAVSQRLGPEERFTMNTLRPQVPYYLDRPYDLALDATVGDMLRLPAGSVAVVYSRFYADHERELRSGGFARIAPEDMYKCVFLRRARDGGTHG